MFQKCSLIPFSWNYFHFFKALSHCISWAYVNYRSLAKNIKVSAVLWISTKDQNKLLTDNTILDFFNQP